MAIYWTLSSFKSTGDLSTMLQNFCRTFFPYPTDCHLVFKDARAPTKTSTCTQFLRKENKNSKNIWQHDNNTNNKQKTTITYTDQVE